MNTRVSFPLARWITYCEVAGVAVQRQRDAPRRVLEQLVVSDFKEDTSDFLPAIAHYSVVEKQILLLGAAVGNTFGGNDDVRVDADARELAGGLASDCGDLVRGTLSDTRVQMQCGGVDSVRASQKVRLSTSAPHSCWWTSPNYVNPYGSDESSLWMTSRLFNERVHFPAGSSLGSLCGEDAFYSPVELLGNALQDSWKLSRLPRPERTLAINSASDFRDMAERFPLAIQRSDDPRTRHDLQDPRLVLAPVETLIDWPRVAEHYEAVHMTCEGYMDCAWLPIETSRGTATATGWSPEATYWLQAPPVCE